MSRALKYFMWGYQPHLWISLKNLAESAFSKLGCEVDPRVFFVGLRVEEKKGSLPVCVEPEECHLQPEEFADLSRRVDVISKAPKTLHRFCPSEEVARRYEIGEHRSAVSAAVREVVEAADGRDRLIFCSHARPVENYLVVVVLQLARRRVEAWPSLARSSDGVCRITRSMIEATADQFVEHCAGALSVPNPGEDFGGRTEVGDLLRAAGKTLGYTPAAAGGNGHGLHTFYDACNVISSKRYEGAAGSGQLVVCRPDHPGIQPSLTFAAPVPLTDYHAARKLLELADGDTYLFTDSHAVYGLGRLAADFGPHREDLFAVRFTGHHVWELWHDRSPLMRVAHNEPRLPLPKLDLDLFLDVVGRALPSMSEADARYVAQLVGVATELRHGSLIVVAEDAAAEAARLERQAVRVQPVRATADVVRRASGIDGALLLDAAVNCHAIGVILDGPASRKATASRGARYNSAVRYVYGRPGTVAVVVSEDGMVNVLPNLMPRIRRADLDDHLGRLREVADKPKVERKELYDVEHWLRAHRFYLNAGECDEVNRLIEQGKSRFGDGGPWVSYGPFTPDEDLDESYFLPEGA